MWIIWGSDFNIPKTIFYLLQGDYTEEGYAGLTRRARCLKFPGANLDSLLESRLDRDNGKYNRWKLLQYWGYMDNGE